MKITLPLISLCYNQHCSIVTPSRLELVNLLCDVVMHFRLPSRYIVIAANKPNDTVSVEVMYIKVILSESGKSCEK